MRSTLPLTATLASLASLLVARGASAQSLVQGRGFDPSFALDPTAMPHVESTVQPGALTLDAGFVLGIDERPYVLREPASRLVDYQLHGHLLAQLGLLPSLAVGVEIPAILAQNGDARALGVPEFAVAGFGDVRATVRWSTRARRRPGSDANGPVTSLSSLVNEGPGFGVLLEASAPTGNVNALAGNGAWVVHPQVVVDFRVFGLVAGAQVGYRARLDGAWPAQSGTCDGSSAGIGVSCLGTTPLHDAVTWSAGVRFPQGLLAGFANAYVEGFGWVDARSLATRTSPIELGVGLQKVFGDFTATLGLNVGLTDAPGVARVGGLAMLQWQRRFAVIDDDNDGVPENNGQDKCPELAEDRDGFEDGDGCPEDNDHDEIPDEEDQCPRVDEGPHPDPARPGCPLPDGASTATPSAPVPVSPSPSPSPSPAAR